MTTGPNSILARVISSLAAKVSVLTVVLVWTFAGVGFANDKAVTWATEDFPPFYTSANETPGTVDTLIEIISAELPDYEHSTEFVPILRIIEQLRNGENIVCASFLYDPKIEDITQYSDVLFEVPPLELAITRDLWVELGEPESISLRQMTQQTGFVLGVSEGRNYGPDLTSIIEDAPDGAVFIRSGDHFKGLARMIELDRITATIAYWGEVGYYSVAEETDNIVSVAIEENPDPLLVYAVIPESEWGDMFLKDFNVALAKAQENPRFSDAVSYWFE